MENALAHVAAITLLLALYALPAYVALWRGHRRQHAIFIVDIFLGWTLVGWLAALAWSLSPNIKNKRRKR
jgi:hypothetical protein